MESENLPVIVETSSCGHTCGAVRHIEDVAHDVDELRREVRAIERRNHEDCTKIYYKIGLLMVTLAAVLPTGWASILGMI